MATATHPKKQAFAKEEENEFSFKELLVKSANYLPLFIIFLGVSFAIALFIYITKHPSIHQQYKTTD